MACVLLPPFPAPPSISPFTIAPPALPPIDLSIDFCCKVNLISYTPAIPLGAAVLAIPGAAAVVAGIQSAITVINAYIDATALKCPRE